jgi:hypothetical protein
MFHHRFSEQFAPPAAVAEHPLPTMPGFMLCPLPLPQGWQGQPPPWQFVYQVAYAQAQAVVAPSRLERYLKPIWN